jgi:hypothetical protein
MIDLCYQDFDFADVLKAFGVKQSDGAQVARLVDFIGKSFESNAINWRVLGDGSVFRRSTGRELFSPTAVIEDMIDFVQLNETIY